MASVVFQTPLIVEADQLFDCLRLRADLLFGVSSHLTDSQHTTVHAAGLTCNLTYLFRYPLTAAISR